MSTETKEKVKSFLNHERYQVVAAAIAIFLIVFGISCESRVRSISNPDLRISRDELNAEVEAFVTKATTKYRDLDRQDELKVLLYDKFMLWTATGVFNPVAILPTIFSILGVGAVTDNVRKRKVIKDNLSKYIADSKAANSS
ncbi:hypothetical protein ES703_26302 [subsurface metagenome]